VAPEVLLGAGMLKRAVLACFAISTVAHADPPSFTAPLPPPPPPSPPVEPKTTNLQLSPIGVIFGFYSIAAERALSSNIALALELDAANTGGGAGTATQAILSLPLYIKRTFSGPFIEPGVLVHSTSYEPAYAGIELLIGWTYLFDSGVNISGAIGISRRIDGDGELVVDALDPSGYFRVGYAF
jgi:hypothetical protein